MTLSEMTTKYDAKKVEVERLQEQLEESQRELEQLMKDIARELGLAPSSNGAARGRRKAASKPRGSGSPRITKERVHAWLSESKGMTIDQLVRKIESAPEGFKTEGLENRLGPILAEVATSRGDKYTAKRNWSSKRGRG